ncbi:unnamed protein product [Auanema sp. JU1783]|nr:unnamed protein product [Auanema sp. JU1783]
MLCSSCSNRLVFQSVRNATNLQIKRGGISSKLKKKKNAQEKELPSTSSAEKVFLFNNEEASRLCQTYPNEIDNLSRKLRNITEKRIEMREEHKALMLEVFFTLKKSLENKERRLYPIGSVVTGLGDENSDLDMVLMPFSKDSSCDEFQKKFEKNEFFRENFLKSVRNVVGKTLRPQRCSYYSKAAVPIVQFNLGSLVGDIQFNNAGTVRSSLYIKSCAENDYRVQMLVDWVKTNFKKHSLLGKQLFRPYHVYMLVLHFLNAIESNLVPLTSGHVQLSPTYSWISSGSLITSGKSVNVKNPSEKSKLSCGELVVFMIDYFSQINLAQVAIHVDGMTLMKRQENDEDSDFLDIIDPYFTTGRRFAEKAIRSKEMG